MPFKKDPEIYEIRVWVKPTPLHPSYGKVQKAVIAIGMQSQTGSDVVERAVKFLMLLGWELCGEPAKNLCLTAWLREPKPDGVQDELYNQVADTNRQTCEQVQKLGASFRILPLTYDWAESLHGLYAPE